MKLGADDKKKVYALGVLGVIMVIAVYSSFFSESSSSPAPAPAAAVTERNRATDAVVNAPAPLPVTPSASQSTRPRNLVQARSRSDEFHPTLRPKREEERVDPRTID